MADYVVAVFTDLVKQSAAWQKISQDPMVGIMGEYKNIAEETASEFGHLHQNFTGDGHFFLFRNADAAVRFGLTLIDDWRQAFQDLPALKEWDPIPLRIGAHFGAEAKLDDDSWVGRCGNTAKSIEGKADPDTLLVSEGMLDLIDLPLYEFSRFGRRKLKSDHIDSRVLFRINAFDRKGFLKKPTEELTAADWFLRAAALIGTDRENTEEEERCYQKAIELSPDYLEAHVNYGALLQKQKRYREAEEHYVQALELRKDDPKAHFNYALLLTLQKRTKEAEAHFKVAIELRKDDPEVHNGYGVLLAKDDRPEEAEEHFKEALRLRPDDPDARNNYAVFLGLQNRLKESEEHYEDALRLRPNDPEFHNNYAILLVLQERSKEAEEHYKEALKLRPDYPEVHYNYAILLSLQKRPVDAEKHYKEALRLRPDDPEIKRAVEEERWKQAPPDGGEEES